MRATDRISRSCQTIGLCWWILCGLCISNTFAFAETKGKVAIYVSGEGKDNNAAAWVEGIWAGALGTRFRSAEDFLEGPPPSKSVAITKAKAAFAAGRKAFNDLNPEQALRQFEESVRLYEAAAGYLDDLSPLSNALLNKGLTFLVLGKKQRGQRAFRQALLYKPKAQLTPFSTEKDKLSVFNAVRSQQSALTKGTIKVNATPTSSVFVDGEYKGLAPLTLKLTKGKHLVLVRRGGYKRWARLVIVTGTPQELAASLSPLGSRTNWRRTGEAASVQTKASEKMPAEVDAFGRVSQTPVVLLAQVKQIGQKVWIQAAAYDLKSSRQLATGGAVVAYGTGQTDVRKLALSLLQSQSVKLNGWTPLKPLKRNSPGQGDKVAKSNTGLIVGLTVTVVVLAGAGVGAYFLFFREPSCSEEGSCIKIELKQ